MSDAKTQATSLATEAVSEVVAQPNVAAEASAVPAIVAALGPMIDAILHSTATAPWYASKTVWAGIVSIVAFALGWLKISFPAETQGLVVNIAITLAPPLVAAGLAFYAHWRQTKKAASALKGQST